VTVVNNPLVPFSGPPSTVINCVFFTVIGVGVGAVLEVEVPLPPQPVIAGPIR
jgi:hypothetical protein